MSPHADVVAHVLDEWDEEVDADHVLDQHHTVQATVVRLLPASEWNDFARQILTY